MKLTLLTIIIAMVSILHAQTAPLLIIKKTVPKSYVPLDDSKIYCNNLLSYLQNNKPTNNLPIITLPVKFNNILVSGNKPNEYKAPGNMLVAMPCGIFLYPVTLDPNYFNPASHIVSVCGPHEKLEVVSSQ